MINDETVRIYVAGDITKEVVQSAFSDFPFNKNSFKLETTSFETKEINKVDEVFEIQNINQAQLMMGFRTNVNALEELYIPMTVFNIDRKSTRLNSSHVRISYAVF